MKKSTSSKNLKFILEKGEDYKTEFKENVDKNLDKEIIAFANSSGGHIYIGITDEGKVKGINITNRLKSQIQDIANNCDSKVDISFQEIKKEKVLIVEVKDSRDKPHKCSSGFYIRSGSSSPKLTRDEIRNFMEEEGILRFDSLPCKKFLYKEHFDKEKLFYFLDKSKMKYSRRDYLQLLENLEVAKRQASKIIFNNAGALFFSKNLKKIFFQTEIICGLFKGTEKVHVLNNENYNIDLIGNIEGAMEFLWKSLRARHELIPRTARRIDVLEIPEKALREALINAVIHTNYLEEGTSVTVEVYDDRVEISNFGGLPARLKKEQFGKKSVRRNPLIADLMARAGYIERMGTGIKKMRDLVKAERLPPIKFEFDNFTTVTFYRKPLPGGFKYARAPEIATETNLSEFLIEKTGIHRKNIDRVLQILFHIENDQFSKNTFSKVHNISLRTLTRYIAILKNNKFISFEGPTKKGKYKVTAMYKTLKKSVNK